MSVAAGVGVVAAWSAPAGAAGKVPLSIGLNVFETGEYFVGSWDMCAIGGQYSVNGVTGKTSYVVEFVMTEVGATGYTNADIGTATKATNGQAATFGFGSGSGLGPLNEHTYDFVARLLKTTRKGDRVEAAASPVVRLTLNCTGFPPG